MKRISSRLFLAGEIVPDILSQTEKRHFLRIISSSFPSHARPLVGSYKFVLHAPSRSLPSALFQLVLPVRLNTFRVAEAAERFLTFSLSHSSEVQNLDRRFSSAVTHRGGLKARRASRLSLPFLPPVPAGPPIPSCFFVPTCTISNCR